MVCYFWNFCVKYYVISAIATVIILRLILPFSWLGAKFEIIFDAVVAIQLYDLFTKDINVTYIRQLRWVCLFSRIIWAGHILCWLFFCSLPIRSVDAWTFKMGYNTIAQSIGQMQRSHRTNERVNQSEWYDLWISWDAKIL